jgi:hypothetical protein
VRYEDIAPAVAGAVVVEYVDAVALGDLEPWWKPLEATRARAAVACDEQPITGLESDRFVVLVVPVGRMAIRGLLDPTWRAGSHDDSVSQK